MEAFIKGAFNCCDLFTLKKKKKKRVQMSLKLDLVSHQQAADIIRCSRPLCVLSDTALCKLTHSEISPVHS